MPPKGGLVMARRMKTLEDEIEALKYRERRRERGEESDSDPEEEEGEGEGGTRPARPQEEEMVPKERRFINALNTVKEETFDVKMEIPMYGGKMDVEEVIDWIDVLNNYFEYKEVPKDKKVNISKIKLKGSSLIWWNYTQGERVKQKKSMITSWDIMVNKLKRKLLPIDHEVQVFRKMQNLK